MPETDPLQAIEAALAAAAASDPNNPEKVKAWLAQRKECLDQNAAQSRTKFWRVVTVVFLALLFLLLVLWLLGVLGRGR